MLASKLEELVPPPCWRPESATRLCTVEGRAEKASGTEQWEMLLNLEINTCCWLFCHLPKHARRACQFLEEDTPRPEELNDSMSIMTPRLNLGGKNQGHYLNKHRA